MPFQAKDGQEITDLVEQPLVVGLVLSLAVIGALVYQGLVQREMLGDPAAQRRQKFVGRDEISTANTR
jgi:hypothetical protein